ncbi:MAG: hypothetical protein Q8O56_13235 [Solirubrobacteraceae bacterium]|nr:hypothetical protein [Solirubrobacteraceae bacterium]
MTVRARIVAATAAGAAVAASLLVLLSGGAAAPAVSPEGSDERPRGVRVGCERQSGAGFPGAYASRRNLVVGPLALVGAAAFTDAATTLEHGGGKFPLLVRARHTVTVSVPASHRAIAGLNYGFQPLGRHTISFTACPAARSQSSAGGPVTFWSGFVLTTVPSCVPLDVWVDGRPRRRVAIAIGRSCAGRAGATPPPPPLRDCATRAEAGRPEPPERLRPQPGDVTIGPLRFVGLARLANPRKLELGRTGPVHRASRRGNEDHRLYRVKAGVLVPAGVAATLRVGSGAEGWAALTYTPHRSRSASGVPAVRFAACAADEPAFSHDGAVGPMTGFPGGFVLARAGCVPLEVTVPGRPPIRARVPFGVRRCR